MSKRIVCLFLALICIIGCLSGCVSKHLTFCDSKTGEEIWMFSKFPALGNWKLTNAKCDVGLYYSLYYSNIIQSTDDYYLDEYVEKIIANNEYFSTFLHKICPSILDKYFAAYQDLRDVIEIECSEPIMCYDFIINDKSKSNWSETDFYNDNRYSRLIEHQYGDDIVCSYYLEENHELIKQAMIDYIQYVFEDYAASKEGSEMHSFECFSYTNGNTITAPLETMSTADSLYFPFQSAYYSYIIRNYYSNWKIKLTEEKGIDGTKTGINMQVSDQDALCHFGTIAFKNSSGDYKGYYDIRGKVGAASADKDLYFNNLSDFGYSDRYFIINDGIYCRQHLDYDYIKCIDNFIEGGVNMVYCQDENEERLLLIFDYDDDELILQFEREN